MDQPIDKPVDQTLDEASGSRRPNRVYAGQRTQTAEDWRRQGWAPDHARQLAATGHRAGQVLVIDEAGVVPLRHYPYHASAGFDWGHSGGAAADLARCILLDHFGIVPVCRGRVYRPAVGELPVRYEDFKADVVARLPRGGDWSLTSEDIDAWIDRARPAAH